MRFLTLCLVALWMVAFAPAAHAQTASDPLEISAVDTPLLFTFDQSALTDLYNRALGSNGGINGFDPAPFAGQLDADAFAVTGLSDGDVNFGASQSSGDYARGNSSGGVTTGGLYAFDVDNDPAERDFALGVQPTGSDMTSGRLFFCYRNTTGVQVTSVNVDYNLHVYNDQPRSTGVAVYYNINSAECDAQQSVTGPLVSATTPASAASSPAWTIEPLEAFLDNVTIDDGEFFVVAVEITDQGGSGSRDEIALDSLRLTFNPATPIPVELASFDAVADGQAASLTWATASETNNSGFAVQHRAPQSSTWREAGFVDGHGTTTQPQRYTFSTGTLDPGTHRFRLRQVDVDGASTLTKPREVLITTSPLTLVGPNPMRSGETAEVLIQPEAAQTVDVAVFDVLGRRVATLYSGPASEAKPKRVPLSTDGFASGRYFIRATGPSLNQTQSISVVR